MYVYLNVSRALRKFFTMQSCLFKLVLRLSGGLSIAEAKRSFKQVSKFEHTNFQVIRATFEQDFAQFQHLFLSPCGCKDMMSASRTGF